MPRYINGVPLTYVLIAGEAHAPTCPESPQALPNATLHQVCAAGVTRHSCLTDDPAIQQQLAMTS